MKKGELENPAMNFSHVLVDVLLCDDDIRCCCMLDLARQGVKKDRAVHKHEYIANKMTSIW